MLKRIKDITEIEADMICSSQNNNCDNCPLYEWHSKECMVRLMNQKINVFDPKNNIEDRNLRKRHVRDIRTKISNENELAQNMICPRCGSKLIERNGRYEK